MYYAFPNTKYLLRQIIQKGEIMGKELVFAAMRHQPVPRAPWVPFCGVHAGYFGIFSERSVARQR